MKMEQKLSSIVSYFSPISFSISKTAPVWVTSSVDCDIRTTDIVTLSQTEPQDETHPKRNTLSDKDDRSPQFLQARWQDVAAENRPW